MTSVFLLQICLLSACSNALSPQNAHPLNINKAVVVARKPTRSNSGISHSPRRHRHPRRNQSVHGSPYRRRTSSFIYCPAFLQKTSRSFAQAKLVPRRKNTNTRREPGSRPALDQMLAIQNSSDEALLPPALLPSALPTESSAEDHHHEAEPSQEFEEIMSRPPSSADCETRSARSASTTSRSTNRLSLTLPIAPPTAWPSRPAPASSAMPSYPPTPMDTPSLMSPVDPNDFITAIAAQERRVLELREELARAESGLTKLKKQWATHEAHKKRAEIRNAEPLRPLGPPINGQDNSVTRQSMDLDKRKALLLGQQSQPGTPTQNRRRIFRGGHTRTLSLLSPTKATDGFSVHEDVPDMLKSPVNDLESPYINRHVPAVSTNLSKRASWAPRSAHQASGVKQIAEDFKAGLWTFMEDLRQATVGEEPITGHGSYLRGIDANSRSATHKANNWDKYDSNQDTIRASATTSRPKASSAFDKTPTPASRLADMQKQEKDTPDASSRHRPADSKKEASKSGKHFSWTPLTINALDDSDWSNWDSPTVKSPRWSGTTVNGDIIPAIPEKQDDAQSVSDQKPPTSRPSSPQGPSSPTNKLEELLPPVLNRLTPSNLKKSASDFMKEWERSLSPPAEPAVLATAHGSR